MTCAALLSGVQAGGVLKDLSAELLQHLGRGTAFLQITTKLNPQGEIRGQVCSNAQTDTHITQCMIHSPSKRLPFSNWEVIKIESTSDSVS